MGVRASKCKLRARVGKWKLGARVCKYKLGATCREYKLGARAVTWDQGPQPEPGAKQRARGQEIQTAKLRSTVVFVITP